MISRWSNVTGGPVVVMFGYYPGQPGLPLVPGGGFAAVNPGRFPNPKAVQSRFAGNNKEAQQFLSRGGQVIIRMRGLPYDATPKQVVSIPT